MKTISYRSLLSVLAFMLVLPGTAAAAKSAKNIKMTFEVKGGALVLKKGWLNTTSSNCKSKNHDGCYDIAKGKLAKFKLTLKKGDADCAKDESWKWHRVVLGGESRIESPLDKPKPAAWGNISSDAAKDFDADEPTGVVNTTPDGKKRVLFEDQNNYPLSIWYKVSVEHCGDGTILEYDPRVDNRG